MQSFSAKPVLEIKLDKIKANFLTLKEKLDARTSLASVVKANSYGLGADRIAPYLYHLGCREFYVTSIDEALDLRRHLSLDAGIYILHGIAKDETPLAIEQNFIPVLNSMSDVESLKGTKIKASLHIDTGMNRLGFDNADLQKLKSNRQALQSFDIKYIMSHLACGDEKGHPKNRKQLEDFKNLVQELGIKAKLSFANSGGVFLGQDYHFDQVRTGAAIYGIGQKVAAVGVIQNTISVKAPILQIRDVKAGETVGYGANYLVKTPTKLATISVGYADGIIRAFEGGGCALLGGSKCKIVGRVSMDVLVLDVGCVKAPIALGDMAEVLGDFQTADDAAALTGTIGYEILTNLGQRYKKVYTG